MKEPKISICASAARPRFWNRFWNSLVWNDIPFEVIFVGPKPPNEDFPENFLWFESNLKPTQCYEAAVRRARGEIIGWTADDANYNHPQLKCPKSIDTVWKHYEAAQDKKVILSMRPFEDGGDIGTRHRLIHDDYNTPLMAPFGFMNREWYMKLGGYDRNFICGQSENDVVMRAIQDGGRVEYLEDAPLWVHHAECHGEYPFRSGYNWDRAFLESCWFLKNREVSNTRLREFEPFDDKDLLTVNQGPCGRWISQSSSQLASV
jgi:hypothetical protein